MRKTKFCIYSHKLHVVYACTLYLKSKNFNGYMKINFKIFDLSEIQFFNQKTKNISRQIAKKL